MMMSDKSILLVDDEEVILSSIGWVLGKHNFKVTTATNGQEAIDCLRASPFDLVITDLMMTPVDGIGVLQQAKSLHPDIGVIILTGYGDVGSAVQSLQQGADDYLQKPCDMDELLRKAGRSFERQDLVARLRRQNQQLNEEIGARERVEQELQKIQADLEQQVMQRTADLTRTVGELRQTLETLLVREEELHVKNRELSDINTTLNTLLKRRDLEHSEIRKEIAAKIMEMVMPLLNRAGNQSTGPVKDYVQTAQANLLEIFSEHPHDSALTHAKLAPRELQIVHYIRQNKTSKEIAELLNLSVRTVEFYRDNIRKKLRITNQKKNLNKFITSIL
jgi:DNA-binding NarL/FixJ family response regulator